ncbi:MAG: zinc ribbon domain-containing protein [Pseudomonadota bacterium]
MPIYQYSCEQCGLFEDRKPIALFDAPCDCPTCGALSPRALTMPQVSMVSAIARRSHAINERSSDSPRRAKANGLTPSGPSIKSRAVQGADGSKHMPGARPWMLSH